MKKTNRKFPVQITAKEYCSHCRHYHDVNFVCENNRELIDALDICYIKNLTDIKITLETLPF